MSTTPASDIWKLVNRTPGLCSASGRKLRWAKRDGTPFKRTVCCPDCGQRVRLTVYGTLFRHPQAEASAA